jgi:hypothetical protein
MAKIKAEKRSKLEADKTPTKIKAEIKAKQAAIDAAIDADDYEKAKQLTKERGTLEKQPSTRDNADAIVSTKKRKKGDASSEGGGSKKKKGGIGIGGESEHETKKKKEKSEDKKKVKGSSDDSIESEEEKPKKKKAKKAKTAKKADDAEEIPKKKAKKAKRGDADAKNLVKSKSDDGKDAKNKKKKRKNNNEKGQTVETTESDDGKVDGASTKGGGSKVEQYRKLHSITIEGTSAQCSAPPLFHFSDTPFGSTILGEVQRAGYTAPTPIQAESWPIALQGHDMISVAKTGSGKTCGFLFPAFMHIIKRLQMQVKDVGNEADHYVDLMKKRMLAAEQKVAPGGGASASAQAPAKSGPKRCKCGSTTHLRTNFYDCPLKGKEVAEPSGGSKQQWSRGGTLVIGPIAVVLAPTRELAVQIQEEAGKFGRSSEVRSVCVFGGAPKWPQIRAIELGVEIVVATPGRLNDIVSMGKCPLDRVSYLVLDEADRMLDMGFEPQIRELTKQVSKDRQTLLFTATWPKEVVKIARDFLKPDAVKVSIGRMDRLVANEQVQYTHAYASTHMRMRLHACVCVYTLAYAWPYTAHCTCHTHSTLYMPYAQPVTAHCIY